jgi:glycosyltransferase involved in cell wall biosynthesis
MPRAKLYPFIRQHDVFIMASDHEGGPLTLPEAMSVGLVPVCNDIPCLVQELVNSENGFRISRDPREFAEAIAQLNRDRRMLERMSDAARRTIGSAYSIEAMAQRYLDFIAPMARTRSPVAWPGSIRPKPYLRSSLAFQLMQRLPPLRPARRIWKRLKSGRSQ